jgi:hypothetical protein
MNRSQNQCMKNGSTIDMKHISPVYGVYISQMIRYARVCLTYDQCLNPRSLQTKKFDVTEVFTVWITGSFSQVLWSLQPFSLPTQLSHWARCYMMSFIAIAKPFVIHWSWLWLEQFTWTGIGAHGGCDRLTGDAYLFYAPDPTSDISSGLCLPFLGFTSPLGFMRLTTVRHLCYFIRHLAERKVVLANEIIVTTLKFIGYVHVDNFSS